MREPSDKTRMAEHRGEGRGTDYKPWIKTREVVGNTGTSTIMVDWKHHRQVHLLSQGELWAYCILRWRDDVVDIREQFPLKLSLTEVIAKRLGYRPPQKTMTTDLLVTYAEGRKTYLKAYAVKSSRKELDGQRCVELRTIERLYWESQGIAFEMVFKEDLNRDFVTNIRNVCRYYDLSDCQTKIHVVCHCIARKFIGVDMRSKVLDIEAITKEWTGDDTKRQYLMEQINKEMDREQINAKYRPKL